MVIEFGWREAPDDFPKTVACIGTFDGVHRGHQEVMRQTVAYAKELRLVPAILTFDRNPLSVLAPQKAPSAVTTWQQTVELASGLGIQVARILPFDSQLKDMEADTFLEEVIMRSLHCQQIVVGYDFAMGKNRIGTAQWLCTRISTIIVPPYLVEGVRVSSSAVRSAIASGEIELASKYLGRPYFMEGVVGKGNQIGRTIGYPTLNVHQLSATTTPADGVYAGYCQTNLGTYRCAISIGHRETFGCNPKLVEAYLLDYPGDEIYGQAVRIQFEKKLRDQQKFDSPEALVHQMDLDIQQIKNLS